MSDCILNENIIVIIIHSFILETCIVFIQETTTQTLPAQSWTKKERLLRDVKFGRVGHHKGPQLKGEIIPCWWKVWKIPIIIIVIIIIIFFKMKAVYCLNVVLVKRNSITTWRFDASGLCQHSHCLLHMHRILIQSGNSSFCSSIFWLRFLKSSRQIQLCLT